MKKERWKVQDSKSCKNNYNIVGYILGSKYKIARVPFMSDKEPISEETYIKVKNEAFEHATLMAASPELLDALKDLLSKYIELVSCGDCGSWDVYSEREVINARLVINKVILTL